MKKIITTLILAILMLSLVSSYYVFYYSFESSSYFMALRKEIKMLEAYWGPYYRVVHGTTKELAPVYLVYMKSEKDPYIIYEKDGISKTQALEIANKNGYKDIEKAYLLLTGNSKEYNNEASIFGDLTWRLYYDADQGYYVEIGFKTGELKTANQK